MLTKVITLLFASSLFAFTPVAEGKETTGGTTSTEVTENIRLKALRDHALAKGLVDGRRAKFIKKQREFLARKHVLDSIYQVDHLYLQPVDENKKGAGKTSVNNAYHGLLVQPPIVLTGKDLMQMHPHGRSMDWSEVRYEISAPARFVTSPIYWMTFLVNEEDVSSQGPADDPVLQPRSEEEKQMMALYYQHAFEEGGRQALIEIEARIKTLTTIIKGMMNYHILASKGVIKKPQIATGYVPVAGNKTQLTLSTYNAQLTEDAEFILDPEKYKAFVQRR